MKIKTKLFYGYECSARISSKTRSTESHDGSEWSAIKQNMKREHRVALRHEDKVAVLRDVAANGSSLDEWEITRLENITRDEYNYCVQQYAYSHEPKAHTQCLGENAALKALAASLPKEEQVFDWDESTWSFSEELPEGLKKLRAEMMAWDDECYESLDDSTEVYDDLVEELEDLDASRVLNDELFPEGEEESTTGTRPRRFRTRIADSDGLCTNSEVSILVKIMVACFIAAFLLLFSSCNGGEHQMVCTSHIDWGDGDVSYYLTDFNGNDTVEMYCHNPQHPHYGKK